jgi:DNA-binding response OmpR family regulator
LGKNAGFEEYLTKPIDVPQMLATISAYLGA